MKKFLLAPLFALLLTGCKIGPFTFSPDSHKPGFFPEGSSSQERVVEFFDGDTLNVSECTPHYISFIGNETNQQPNLTSEEDIRKVMVDNGNAVTSITDIANVGQFHGLKIGNLAQEIDGKIKFNLSFDVVAVSIKARPRASMVIGETSEFVIDTDVGISVNGSKYVKLSSAFSKMSDVADTICNYDLSSSPKNYLELNVAYSRAEIMEITLYE